MILAIVSSGLLLIPVCNLQLLSFQRRKKIGSSDSLQCIESMTDVKSYFPIEKSKKVSMLFRFASASIAEKCHRQRLGRMDPIPFSSAPLSDYRAFREKLCDDLVVRNRIRFIDPDKNVWRPRVLMALWMYIATNTFQLSRLAFSDYIRLKIQN